MSESFTNTELNIGSNCRSRWVGTNRRISSYCTSIVTPNRPSSLFFAQIHPHVTLWETTALEWTYSRRSTIGPTQWNACDACERLINRQAILRLEQLRRKRYRLNLLPHICQRWERRVAAVVMHSLIMQKPIYPTNPICDIHSYVDAECCRFEFTSWEILNGHFRLLQPCA